MKSVLFILIIFFITIVLCQTNTTSEIINTITTNGTTTISPTKSTSLSATVDPISTSPTTTLIFQTPTNNPIVGIISTVEPTGFNDQNLNQPPQEHWLKRHKRYVFIIFVGLVLLGMMLWYVIKSVKSMRARLESENAANLYIMQQAAPPPQQQNIRNDRIIPEYVVTPPPPYKTRENTPVVTSDNHQ